MRVTNNMIMQNSIRNINTTKENTSKLNDQMTSQKKITKASEDPVIAIRSLRLRNTQSQINQYLDKNITDASNWLDNTETALTNIKTAITSIYDEIASVTDTLSLDDKNTILAALKSYREEVYSEGNADLNGRTLLTGYKTSDTLTFLEDSDATYEITEEFSYKDIEEKSYYANSVTVPTTLDGSETAGTTEIPTEVTNTRIRLSYDNLTDQTSPSIEVSTEASSATLSGDDYTCTFIDISGNTVEGATFSLSGGNYTYSDGTNTYTYDSTTGQVSTTISATTVNYDDWEDNDFEVGASDVYYIPETGELVLGSSISNGMKAGQYDISFTYEKTGFAKGEVKPEMYFDCVNETDTNSANWITYTKEDQQIKYTISTNTTLTVNVQASDVFSADIGRDIDEMIDAMQAAINAQTKVDDITAMMGESQYSDESYQTYLSDLLATAQTELDLAEDNVDNLFSNGLTNFQGYLDDVATAISDVGNKGDQLDLVKSRMTDQQTAIESLISDNEDMDLSEIVIEYTAAYNAYESALLAASKASDQTLLDYL